MHAVYSFAARPRLARQGWHDRRKVKDLDKIAMYTFIHNDNSKSFCLTYLAAYISRAARSSGRDCAATIYPATPCLVTVTKLGFLARSL